VGESDVCALLGEANLKLCAERVPPQDDNPYRNSGYEQGS
jgi:hypothetical protein